MHEIRGTNFWDTLYALVHSLIFSESHGTYKQKRVKKAEVVYVSILNQSCLGCLKARPFHGLQYRQLFCCSFLSYNMNT